MSQNIMLDVRGCPMRYNKDLLEKIPYFQGKFNPNIDCDPDVFRELIGYVETGELPTGKYNLKYIKFMANKFSIDMTEVDDDEKLFNTEVKKINETIINLANKISKTIKYDGIIYVDFYESEFNSVEQFDSEIICMLKPRLMKHFKIICSCPTLAENLFGNVLNMESVSLRKEEAKISICINTGITKYSDL